MILLGPNPKLRTLQGVISRHPSLLVELPSSQPARLDVFDLQGRRVRTLADRRLPRGATVLEWDGRDAAGAAVPRGLYFARLTTPLATRTARILVR
jgi:flagellar hook assembly protein FlgD